MNWIMIWKPPEGLHGLKEWVPREHAEAEIEKARREGQEQGTRDYLGTEWRKTAAAIRADERERIVREFQSVLEDPSTHDDVRYGMMCARDRVMGFDGILRKAKTPEDPQWEQDRKDIARDLNRVIHDWFWKPEKLDRPYQFPESWRHGDDAEDMRLFVSDALRTINALVEAVTELQRKVREVAPWLA